MKAAVFAVLGLFLGWHISPALAVECHVFMACDKHRCIDVPGNFVQRFEAPKGGAGQASFLNGYAYIFAHKADVALGVRSGEVSTDIRYAVYPDEAPNGEAWLDAQVMAVQWLSWEGGKPTFSKEVSFMACSTGNA